MKILRLDLRAFGPFTDVEIDLSRGQEGLHLILGPNEAGKSSALRALRQMLFGIDARTNDNFRHEYPQLRVGGTLRDGQGVELSFLRLKRQRNTLKSPDENDDIDEASLSRILGGLTLERYSSLFSLDHETLVTGGREIAAGKGSVAELIFGAGSDLRRLRDLQKRLDAEHFALFKPRASVLPLNKSFQELNAARDAIEAASLKSSEWVAEDERLTESEHRKADLDARLQERHREANRLHRIQLALPDLSARKDRLADLDRLADAPRIREGFAQRLADARNDLQQAGITLEYAEKEVARLSEEIEKLGPLSPLLAHRDTILDFAQRLGSVRSRSTEVQRIEPEKRLLESRVLSALRELDRPISLDHAEELRLPAAQRERIRALEHSGRDLLTDCKTIHKSIESLQSKHTEIDRNLNGQTSPVEVSVLSSALKRARQAGDLEGLIKDSRKKTARNERHAASALAKLEPWTGTFDDLGRVAIPSEASIETHRAALESADQSAGKAREHLAEIEEQHAQTLAQLTAIQGDRPVPSLEELNAIRTRRDDLWASIETHLTLPETPLDPRLAAEFRQSLADADQLADHRFAETDRLAKIERLEADRLQQEAVITSRRAHLNQMLKNQESAEAQWKDLWSALGFTPRSPREMLAWHHEFERLATRAEELRQENSELEEDVRRLDALRRELVASLDSAGRSQPSIDVSLSDLIDLAQSVLDDEKQRTADRKRLTAEIEKTKRELEALQEDEKDTLRRHHDWKDAWAKALRPLGLEPETSGQEAITILDLIQSALADYERLGQLRQQLDTHEREKTRLETEAHDLASRLDSDLASEPLEGLIAELGQKLQEASEVKTKRESLLSTKKAQTTKAVQARERLTLADARLKELADEIGAASIDEIPVAEEKAQLRAAAEADLLAIETRLRNFTAGQDLDAFIADAEREIPRADSLEAIRLSLESEIQQLSEQRDAAASAETEARVRLQQMDDNAKQAAAYTASIQAQQILARIDAQTQKYIRMKMASSLLRQAVESYRARSQAPVLKRASNLFASLTCGSFVGLDTELDDHDQPRIVGLRPDGSRLTVDQMSEGTCDQLYLALKLASLEHDLDHGTAFPFVADDILVNFDDQRAQAALRVLAELSKKTQVLFFTHHEHLVRLAQSVLPPEVLFVQGLPRPYLASTAS